MNKSGFSLIELLLVMAILAILSTGVAIWFLGYQRQAEIDSGSKMIVGALRDAQSRSISGKDFKRWGVYFDAAGNKFILFAEKAEGQGFSTAEVKEENYLSNFVKFGSISLNGGGSEIIFNKPGGDSSQFGTIRIEEASNSANFQDITVNQLGKIDSR